MAKFILKIWHRTKHDDGEVTERTSYAPQSDVDTIIQRQGFWLPNDQGKYFVEGATFIPWHSISWIEVIEEPR